MHSENSEFEMIRMVGFIEEIALPLLSDEQFLNDESEMSIVIESLRITPTD